MNSVLVDKLRLKYQPVAIYFTDTRPDDAIGFKEGAWGCVISLLGAAGKGKTAYVDREHCGCAGGQAGMCLTSSFIQPPGGMEYFLSVGAGEGFREGEFYKKTPERALEFMNALELVDIPNKYVVMRPLSMVDQDAERPALICTLCNPDQLSALTFLHYYDNPSNDNIAMPFAAGCHSVCLIPLNEQKKDAPRAVVGLTDVTARNFLDPDILSFTVSFDAYLKLESDAPGSFLDKHVWGKLRERI